MQSNRRGDGNDADVGPQEEDKVRESVEGIMSERIEADTLANAPCVGAAVPVRGPGTTSPSTSGRKGVDL